jgi:multimeric flavodoxin WrbA
MKKVTAFVSSARRKHTYKAVEQFLATLQSMGEVEYEIVRLFDYHLEPCRGCKLCCDKGEELCPLKDDRDVLIEKMMASDGVIFASPNYSFHVSGMMKVFLDKLGFVLHRPRFFGKTFTSIVAQGVYGGNKIVDYFNFVGRGLGFSTVKGSCITTLEPMTEKQQKKIDRTLADHAERFYARLQKPGYPVPSLVDLLVFRMSRTRMRLMLDESFRDFVYYRDKGWFESDFYYPTRLGPFKKGAGKILDTAFAGMTRAR